MIAGIVQDIKQREARWTIDPSRILLLAYLPVEQWQVF